MEVQKSSTEHVVVTINQPIQQPLSKTKTLKRLNFSKPRSRFEENNYPLQPRTIPETEQLQPLKSSQEDTNSSTSDDEDWFAGEKGKSGKINKRAVIEWTLFLIIMTGLVCSLTLDSLKHKVKWGLEIWKWCVMVMVMFCGRLVSGWVVGFFVFLIERNFMLREKVVYFVFGLRKSFQNCAWLGLVLVAWTIMFPDVHEHSKVLQRIFRALIAVLIGATIWLLKILFVKVLASSFHVATFFDRMKESAFHHIILEALSGPPLYEDQREDQSELPRHCSIVQASKSLPAKLSNKSPSLSKSNGQDGSRRIDMEMLRRLSSANPRAWNVKKLVNYVRSSGFSTISQNINDFGNAQFTSERKAKKNAERIFKNVAKPNAEYIEKKDLLLFLTDEEFDTISPLFEGEMETGQITESSFRNWVVHAYMERKALAHSLNDTKTAVHQLHKLASAVVVVIITVMSILVMGLATSKVLLVVTSQLLLVGFMFKNMCKTVFESIIFVFVMHPFDVGDRCVIDGVQLIVEEMNILTTVFLRYDNEKIYFPNFVLLTKPISNFRRSPDMGDTVNFTIDVSTPIEDVTELKKSIKLYIDSNPKYWQVKHSVIVKEIENVDKMIMTLYVQHTMNHQNYMEKLARRSELVLELKKIFQNLGIQYHLLPQEVNLTQINMSNGM